MEIKILVAAHKPYPMPEDSIYYPIHVGARGKEPLGFAGDDTGENISARNARLCELTAVYWAWKNLEADYIGLAHYRRHFTIHKDKVRGNSPEDRLSLALTRSELEPILRQCNLILPVPRNYYIETLESHFVHLPYAHEKDLRLLEQVIGELFPEYLSAFRTVMNRKQGHMFNMFVMKRELLQEYCEFLFPVLLEVDRRLDLTGYSPMEARAAGYLGEFMLDIWLEKNPIPYRELDVLFTEPENLFSKGITLVKRKLLGGLG
ncbi:MAG: DUF4422 domain-containing protein [Massiliimalia sp.]